MQKLISELTRLYLPAGTFSPEVLAQHLLGQTTLDIKLTTDDGLTRAMVIPSTRWAMARRRSIGAGCVR